MDYSNRLKKIRDEMTRHGVDLLYLTRGANLWYLTGIRRRGAELTDHNAYGDYVCGAYLTQDKITLVGPRMGGSGWKTEAEGKSYITEVIIFDEHRDPVDVQKEVLSRYNPHHIMVDDRAWAQTLTAIRRNIPTAELSLAGPSIFKMRMIKEAGEIAAMKAAGRLTDKVYSETVDYLKSGVTEVGVEKEIDRLYADYGAEQNSFVTAVRFRSPKKPSGTAPPHKRKLEEGDSISFDFGCLLDGYANDFGRTAFCGKPPTEVEKIHTIVMESQARGIQKMVDGAITAEELDREARGIIEKAGYGDYFMHRLGHGIGVTVHEPPYLYRPDNTLLKTNMTFTVEPSILLPQSWSARVEDVVLVTANGGETFTKYHKELTILD
jgi:D-alanyl-D-alanine dipeptidase